MLPFLSRLRRDRQNSKEQSEDCSSSEPEVVDYFYLDGFFVENPPDNFSCPICLCPVQRKAYLTECCGRHFCYECIQRLVGTKPCPMCKHAPLIIFPNKERQREINSLAVCCPVSLVDSKDEVKNGESGISNTEEKDEKSTGKSLSKEEKAESQSSDEVENGEHGDVKCVVCDWKGELSQLEGHLKAKHGDDRRWRVAVKEPVPVCRQRSSVISLDLQDFLPRRRSPELPYRTIHPSALGSYISGRRSRLQRLRLFDSEPSDDSSDDEYQNLDRARWIPDLSPLERAIVEIRNFPEVFEQPNTIASSALPSESPENQLESFSQLGLVDHITDYVDSIPSPWEDSERSEAGAEGRGPITASGVHAGDSVNRRRIPTHFRCPHNGHSHHIPNVSARAESHIPNVHPLYHLPRPHHQHHHHHHYRPPLQRLPGVPHPHHHPPPPHHYHHHHGMGHPHHPPISHPRPLHWPPGHHPPPFQPPHYPPASPQHLRQEAGATFTHFPPPPLHWHPSCPRHPPPPPPPVLDDPVSPMQSVWYSPSPRSPPPTTSASSLWQNSSRPASPPPWDLLRPSSPPPPHLWFMPQSLHEDLLQEPQEEQNSVWTSTALDVESDPRSNRARRHSVPVRPGTPYTDL